jgi:hypothetical protein
MQVTVHVIAPGFSSSLVGGGGTSLFRGVALASSQTDQTLCHEVAALDGPKTWVGGPRIKVLTYETGAALLAGLQQCARAGDLIVKFSGVDWSTDPAVDLALLRQRGSNHWKVVYADADAPSRLPFLIRHASYLPRVLDGFDAVALFAGGGRAVHEYGCLTSTPVFLAGMALAAMPFRHFAAATNESRVWDLLVVVGAQSAREEHTTRLLERCAAIVPGLRIAAVGDLGGLRALGEVDGHVGRDALELAELYARSRFTLNMLRPEARAYSHVPSCRLFEAPTCGGVITTEPFAGLASYFEPEVECAVFRTPDDLALRLRMVDEQRDAMGAAARARVEAEVDRATQEWAVLLAEVMK